MSIVWSLKKLFDPATQNYEEGEQGAERELPEDDDSGDPPRFGMEPAAVPASQAAPERYQCRICGHIIERDRDRDRPNVSRRGASSRREAPYCPECLADTMKPVS